MPDRIRFGLCLTAALLALAALGAATHATPPAARDTILILMFGALIAFSMSFSTPLGSSHISLMPVLTVATYLIHGRVIAGWVLVVAMVGHAAVRRWRRRHLPESHEPGGLLLVEVTLVNLAMHLLGLLAGDAVYRALDGPIPVVAVAPLTVVQVLLCGLLYLAVNHTLIAGYLTVRGLWKSYTGAFPDVLIYEAGPLILAPLIVLIYTRLGVGYFVLFAMALTISSLISHNLAVTSERLQRRLQELSSLQAVGQALSQSLDLEAVVNAVYDQVASLGPAASFYIALYDRELDEVSFPLTIEGQQRLGGVTRRARRGLTEYVLETGQPILLHHDVASQAMALGVEQIGRPAACYLGIPLMAGDETLGMFAVQSYDDPEAYDTSDLAVLQAIAAQAAIAIQNARLYARTDEALAQRVRELDSVLRTTREGILLLDREWRVLAGNRALAEFLRVAQMDLPRHPIDALRHTGESLAARIGVTLDQLRAEGQQLHDGKVEQITDHLLLAPSKVPIERTMTPVRDSDGTISGWLMVFRDMTEELELARLHEEMTHMLVHDLRSPLALVQGSLAMLSEAHETGTMAHGSRLIGMASRSCDHILTMVNQLLDIGQLEDGRLALQLERVSVEDLLNDVYNRYAPAATANSIRFDVEPDGDLPALELDRLVATRMVSNLVDNAMKFTPDGGRIRMRAYQPAGSDVVHLAVHDTGPGIPEAAQRQLFQKFRQIPEIAGRRRGTGLGLFFCKLAAEAHGGTIWVDSTMGAGSTFTVALPVQRPPA